MRTHRILVAAAAALSLLAVSAVSTPAFAMPPMTFDAGSSAEFWTELTGGPFAARGEAAVLRPANTVAFLQPIAGASKPTRGFYMLGNDALHLVPHRLGFWGWGLMLGGDL